MRKVTVSTTANDSSGRTFDLNAIASGSNGARVTNTNRACRLTLTVHAVRDLKRKTFGVNVKDPIFKIIVDGEVKKSIEIKGKPDENGAMNINENLTFDVTDIKNSVLVVQVYVKGLFGNEFLGQCRNIRISELVYESKERQVNMEAEWYELYSKDGKAISLGKVLMQISAGVAKPEQELLVFVGTWNVGNSRPGDDLSSWLPTTPVYDIIAIGTQECDYPARAPYADCSKDWMATLMAVLGSSYKLINGNSRGQMRLALFVHVDTERAISEIYSASEATGVGNVMPNKGGVCISFKFWDTYFCFVNCHLAAHIGQCEARNKHFREIAGNICINNPKMDILNQFHYVFWFGDLNYRLDIGAGDAEKHAWEEVVHHISHKNFQTLLQYDELHKEQTARRVLYNFKEGQITFPPTFKMKKDQEFVYDLKRLPAWCDRILWFSFPGCNVEQISYSSATSVSTSDHKPVYAEFRLMAYALPCNSLDNLDEDDKRWHVRFTVLRARHLRALDISGHSNPYISFVGPNLSEEAHTTVRFQNLNPVWNPLKDLPTLVLNTFAIQRLEKEYLMVRVVNYEPSATMEDILGYGVIPLSRAVAAFKSRSTADFIVELSYRGCPAGTLEGTMKLTWERNVTKRTNLTGKKTQPAQLSSRYSFK